MTELLHHSRQYCLQLFRAMHYGTRPTPTRQTFCQCQAFPARDAKERCTSAPEAVAADKVSGSASSHVK